MSDPLIMWVIIKNPKDMPNFKFVARKHLITPGVDTPTDEVLATETIEVMQDFFRKRGLVCINRHPEDDPAIVETWL